MTRPVLLDLFCGAGGSAVGYHRAGFDVVGVDCRPQPRYPFRFLQADALEYAAAHGRNYAAIHASPPCQRYSIATRRFGSDHVLTHPDLLPETRRVLLAAGRASDAEAVYREDLKQNPENGWSLYGLAQCLRARKAEQEAGAAEQRFQKAWARADVTLRASRF